MYPENVDVYLRDGCGRCEHVRTPACKVLRWTAPLEVLRALLLRAGLEEAIKWGQPCYTLGGKNVALLASFKESVALSFFRGAALSDPEGLTEAAGPNARLARLVRFQSLAEVEAQLPALGRLVEEAIALERSGRRTTPPPAAEPLPAELQARLAADPALQRAFAALTPGRRRSHVLHVGGAQQTQTRARRAERCVPAILAGRGFNER